MDSFYNLYEIMIWHTERVKQTPLSVRISLKIELVGEFEV